ncbi:MAG: trimeric intracellular cation channel family protein [Fibrobacterota bacterium]
MDLIFWADLFGTAVFAVSGAMVAARREMDIFGGVVLSYVTALGGGTLRDVLLDAGPVFWIEQEVYLATVAVTSVVTFFFFRNIVIPRRVFLLFDAFGLAVFTGIGTMVGYAETGSASVSLLTGVMTGVAGGVIRDVLADDIPLILRREIYATASFFGSLVYLMLISLGTSQPRAMFCAVSAVLIIRITAIIRRLSLPRILIRSG